MPGKTGRHPLPEVAAFTETLRRFGVEREAPVVAYDDAGSTSRAGVLLRYGLFAPVALAVWLLVRSGKWPSTWQLAVLSDGLAANVVVLYAGAIAEAHG